MRPITFASLILTAGLLGLGSASAAPVPSDSCTAGCATPSLSADDQATCRLQCALLAQAPPPAAKPPAQPVPPQPIAAQPVRPTGTPVPPPAAPQPIAAQPVRPPGTPAPIAAPAPQEPHLRALCESQCDAEPVASDRATCRLQCAQLSRVSAPPTGGTTTTTTTTGSTTTYSFGPGGGSVPSAPTTTPPNYTAPNYTPPSYPASVSPSGQQQQIAACQATCERESSSTDRATCRNNCGAVGTVLAPPAPGKWVLGPAPASSDADQRAAVIRSSQGVVGGAPPASTPPPATTNITRLPTEAATPPQQQFVNPQCAAHFQSCSISCAGGQTSCAAQCDQGKVSPTDRATCKLTCESNGDMCRDDCRMKEAACRGPTYR